MNDILLEEDFYMSINIKQIKQNMEVIKKAISYVKLRES